MKFKLSNINCVLIALGALTFCIMFVYFKQIADNALIHSLVQEKLLKIDYNNNYLEGTAIMLEDGYDELIIDIRILESHVGDIERRLKIIEKLVKE